MEHVVEAVLSAVSASRIRHRDESQLHDAIGFLLAAHLGYHTEHEHRLGPADRLDFFLPEHGLAVECKVDGSSSDVIRQLHRYLGHADIKGVVLVTTLRRHVVPPVINGKPVWVCLVSSGA